MRCPRIRQKPCSHGRHGPDLGTQGHAWQVVGKPGAQVGLEWFFDTYWLVIGM
jgi:hypothetical protein